MRQQYYQSLDGELKTVLPYLAVIRERLSDIPLKPATETPLNCYGILRSHLVGPLAMELIWSYWHEEGMLVQTLLAILARFENRKIRAGTDPLARFDLDPLRPLSQPAVGLDPGRVPAAHRTTAGARVRPRVRPQAAGPRGTDRGAR